MASHKQTALDAIKLVGDCANLLSIHNRDREKVLSFLHKVQQSKAPYELKTEAARLVKTLTHEN